MLLLSACSNDDEPEPDVPLTGNKVTYELEDSGTLGISGTVTIEEREDNLGSIYVEAADKVTLKKIRDITFVNARDVLGIIYNSKSGNTSLKWRQLRRNNGKVSGEASSNSLINLAESGVLTLDWVESYLKKKSEEKKTDEVVS